MSTHINKKSHQPEPVSAKADSSNKEENQCQRDKTELLTTLHVKGKLVTLPLDGKVPATLPNQNHPHKWGVGATMLRNSAIKEHIKSRGEKGNLGIVLRGQHIVIDGDMKWYPDWKGQDGGVYDRDNSGKYKIKRINPPKKGGKAAKGIKSDYCVDMMAFILDAWGLGDVGTGTETSGGGRHIHLLAPKGVNTKELKKHLHEFKFKNEEGGEGNALEFLREGNYVLTVGVTEYDDGSKRYHTLPNGIDPLDKDNMPEATQVMIDALSQSRNPESKAPTHHNANGTHAVSDTFSNLNDPNSVEPTADQINSIKFNTYLQKTPEQVRLILEKVKGWDEYHKWIDVGHALKHWANESDGDMDAEAFALFDEWSRQSKTEYDKADCRKTWEGFKPHDSNPITLGSLIAEIEDDCTPDEIAAIKHTDPAHIKWARLDTIKTQVPDVQALDVNIIPESLRPWLADVSHRMQSPVDFVAVSAITVIGSVVGAGCGMRPKAVDNWEVTPNLWGACIGRPSVVLKSPSMAEVMGLLDKLQSKHKEKYEKEKIEAKFNKELNEASLKDIRTKMGKLAKKGRAADNAVDSNDLKADFIELSEDMEGNEVKRRVFKTNEVSIQSMTVLQNNNPRGVLFFRDELPGLLIKWSQEEYAEERTYFLAGWNGDGSYTDFKIGRGLTEAENICVSMLGGIQPDKLMRCLIQAKEGNNDGLLQRLQLAVYPDEPKNWVNIDEAPDDEAKEVVYKILSYLADVNFEDLGATKEEGRRPYFRFNDKGQSVFDNWLTKLQTVKIKYEDSPFMVEHLGKFRSLMPSLALIFHLFGQGERETGAAPDDSVYGGVSADNAGLAIKWCNYLETHARRIYGMLANPEHEAAVKLTEKIKAKKLPTPFTVRQVQRKGWEGLGDNAVIKEAMPILIESNWVLEVEKPYTGNGRKPAPNYHINPEAYAEGDNLD